MKKPSNAAAWLAAVVTVSLSMAVAAQPSAEDSQTSRPCPAWAAVPAASSRTLAEAWP